jgi:hypothetical protein
MSVVSEKIHRRLVPFLVEGRINSPVLSASEVAGASGKTVVRVCVRDMRSKKQTESDLKKALADLDGVVLALVN